MIVFSSFCGGGQPAIDVPARTNYNLRGHRSEVGGADHVVVVLQSVILLFCCFTVGGDLAVPADGVVGGVGGW